MTLSSFRCALSLLNEANVVLKTHELADGTTRFGRGPTFNIVDRRVSRGHCSIVVDSASSSVTILPNSTNASYIIREHEEVLLVPHVPVVVQDGDILSLLEHRLRFRFAFADDDAMLADPTLNDADATLLDAPVPRIDPSPPRDDDMLHKSEFVHVKVIGAGSCGEVSLAKWRGGMVAVKKIFRALIHGNALKEFMAEVSILRRLRHPNIVLFMGMYHSDDDDETGIVTEYLRRGSLADVLAAEGPGLLESQLVRMASDTARGMNYLHTCRPPIIHRDLKSHNLLVGDGYTIKVTDFGLARTFGPADRAKTFCGTAMWTAPEVFGGGGYTEKADVYSFGVVLWELCARGTQEPYAGVSLPHLITGVTTGQLRPAAIAGAPKTLVDLAARCWQQEPDARPAMSEIVHLLDAIVEENQAARAAVDDRMPDKKRSRDDIVDSSGTAEAPRKRQETQPPSSALHMSYELDAEEVVIGEELGQGTSAVVFKGTYRGQTVAVKVLKDAAPDDEFDKELDVMARLRSPSVVFFYGALMKPQMALVVEYFAHGSLYDVMNGTTTNVMFDWDLVLRLALGASRATNALHSWRPEVVHRDLKSPNLLVDESFNVKVGDFGLARFKTDSNRQTLCQMRGTYAYLAPESYNGHEFTTASDCFALAIILWELINRLITGEYMRPYQEHKELQYDYQIIIQTAKHGLRPLVHTSTPAPLRKLMETGWHESPKKRPTAAQFVESLVQVEKLYRAQKAQSN